MPPQQVVRNVKRRVVLMVLVVERVDTQLDDESLLPTARNIERALIGYLKSTTRAQRYFISLARSLSLSPCSLKFPTLSRYSSYDTIRYDTIIYLPTILRTKESNEKEP